MTATPLSLYFDLEPEQNADLVVVSRAAIAWASTISEIAYVVDPSIEIRIEFQSGTEGSLSINTMLRAVGDRLPDQRTIKTAMVSAAMWFVLEIGSWTVGNVLDWMNGPDAPPVIQELSQEEREAIATEVVHRLRNVGTEQAEHVFREVEKDQAIKGIGVTSVPGKRPDIIIPRTSFDHHTNQNIQETEARNRTRTNLVEVVLVSPVLAQDAPTRRWKLHGAAGEFGAVIKDRDFLERVWSGQTGIPLVAGIKMDVELEIAEKFDGDVWRPMSYSVAKVVELRPPARIEQLPLTPRIKPDRPETDNDDS